MTRSYMCVYVSAWEKYGSIYPKSNRVPDGKEKPRTKDSQAKRKGKNKIIGYDHIYIKLYMHLFVWHLKLIYKIT